MFDKKVNLSKSALKKDEEKTRLLKNWKLFPSYDAGTRTNPQRLQRTKVNLRKDQVRKLKELGLNPHHTIRGLLDNYFPTVEAEKKKETTCNRK